MRHIIPLDSFRSFVIKRFVCGRDDACVNVWAPLLFCDMQIPGKMKNREIFHVLVVCLLLFSVRKCFAFNEENFDWVGRQRTVAALFWCVLSYRWLLLSVSVNTQFLFSSIFQNSSATKNPIKSWDNEKYFISTCKKASKNKIKMNLVLDEK